MGLSVTEVAAALAGVGFNLTPAETALAENRVAQGYQDAVTAVEFLLDERCGPSGRGMVEYPNVALLLGGETTVTLPDPEPEPEPVVELEEEPVEEPEPAEDADKADAEDNGEPEAEADAAADFEIGVDL